MKIKLSEDNIRSGEERAFQLFLEEVARGRSSWIRRADAMRYRGVGRVMVRKVFAVARHIEGGKLSRSLGERGVDTVSATSIRAALHRLGNGLIRIARQFSTEGAAPDGVLGGGREELGRASSSGSSLARYIHRSQ